MHFPVQALEQAGVITIFVFCMMVLTDYLNIFTKGKMSDVLRKRRYQYVVASFLGATPGCLGTFMCVSFYVHGVISFGALTAAMISTFGDEAYVMLLLFPRDTLILMLAVFALGVVGGIITDKVIVPLLRIVPCERCELHVMHDECRRIDISALRSFPRLSSARYALLIFSSILIALTYPGLHTGEMEPVILFSTSILLLLLSLLVPDHYIQEHILQHLVRRHVWRVFLWTFSAIILIELGLSYFDLHQFVSSNLTLVLLISAIVGLIPESGPHMVFVMMYYHHLIPFSVLLTSSIVQDGHGMLPLLSYTVRDSVLIKLVNLCFGLVVGIPLYLLGL